MVSRNKNKDPPPLVVFGKFPFKWQFKERNPRISRFHENLEKPSLTTLNLKMERTKNSGQVQSSHLAQPDYSGGGEDASHPTISLRLLKLYEYWEGKARGGLSPFPIMTQFPARGELGGGPARGPPHVLGWRGGFELILLGGNQIGRLFREICQIISNFSSQFPTHLKPNSLFKSKF